MLQTFYCNSIAGFRLVRFQISQSGIYPSKVIDAYNLVASVRSASQTGSMQSL